MTLELATAPAGCGQQTYHTMRDCFARPGQIVSLPPAPSGMPIGALGYQALVGLALLNRSTSFAALGPGSEYLADYLSAQSGATRVDPSLADVIFAAGDRDDMSRSHLHASVANCSEPATTLIFGVRNLSTLPSSSLYHLLAHLHPTLLLSLSGPGIPAYRTVRASGLTSVNLARFVVLNAEQGRGADLVLVDSSGLMLGLPRTTNVTWHGITSG